MRNGGNIVRTKPERHKTASFASNHNVQCHGGIAAGIEVAMIVGAVVENLPMA